MTTRICCTYAKITGYDLLFIQKNDWLKSVVHAKQ